MADTVEQRRRQAAGLGPEHERIAGPVVEIAVAVATTGLDREHARIRERREARIEILMHPDLGQSLVVESGTLETLGVESESQGPDEVQRGAGVGTQPDRIAGVRRYLGLKEHQVNHHESSTTRWVG